MLRVHAFGIVWTTYESLTLSDAPVLHLPKCVAHAHLMFRTPYIDFGEHTGLAAPVRSEQVASIISREVPTFHESQHIFLG